MEIRPTLLEWKEDGTGRVTFNDGSTLEFDDHGSGNHSTIKDKEGNHLQPGTPEWNEREEVTLNLAEYESQGMEVIEIK